MIAAGSSSGMKFVDWKDDNWLEVHALSLATGSGSEGDWRITPFSGMVNVLYL